MKKKTFDELTFTDDFMFCKVLTTNLELCREMLELILGKDIGEIELVKSQETIELISDAKGVKLDVVVKNIVQTRYNAEMQATKSDNLPKRSRYYQGMSDLNTLERGEKYDELKDSYTIFICLFDLFGLGLPVYTFESTCIEVPGLKLEDGATKVFVNAYGISDEMSEDLKQFLSYLTDGTTESDFT